MYLTERPIDFALLVDLVQAPERGGVACFLGTVRNHHGGHDVERLEYSAYPPMAEAQCVRIVEEAESKWPVKVILEHRVGALGIGDIAVAVVVGAPHRDQAFEACRYVVEELKRRVPIWKREYYVDGSVAWVDPTAPGGTRPAEPGVQV